MYKQFCRNLRHYIKIMDTGSDKTSSRKSTAEVLLKLADVETYKKLKENNSTEYRETINLIYELSQYSEKYPSLKRLTWELWAYGFDIVEDKKAVKGKSEVEEVAKLADLLASTHYFE